MVEAIAIKLLSTLAGFMFETMLHSSQNVQIEGAPGWYMKPSDADMIWVFAFEEGGKETIESVQAELRNRMQGQIQQAIEIILYDNFRNITDPKELAFVEQVRNDPNLPVFISKYMQFDRIEHQQAVRGRLLARERAAMTFGSAKLPRAALMSYQRERLGAITRAISVSRAEEGHRILQGGQVAEDDPFSELPASGVLVPADGAR